MTSTVSSPAGGTVARRDRPLRGARDVGQVDLGLAQLAGHRVDAPLVADDRLAEVARTDRSRLLTLVDDLGVDDVVVVAGTSPVGAPDAAPADAACAFSYSEAPSFWLLAETLARRR